MSGNTIDTTGWILEPKQEARFLHIGTNKIPVYVRYFTAPNNCSALLYPAGRLAPEYWRMFIDASRRNGKFSVTQKAWVWSKLSIEKDTSVNAFRPAPPILTKEAKLLLREQRKKQAEEFEQHLAELSKQENVPEADWPSYKYPGHLIPSDPVPTALQRIVVSRYWNQPACLLGASVGAGKSRMVIDILSARALAPGNPRINDSARIVLLVAPLSLHQNWIREFQKWGKNNALNWHVMRFFPGKEFWKQAERKASSLFDREPMVPGGVVILVTHQALSRPTLMTQLKSQGWVPTAIVVDEVQRFFRNPDNLAYKNLSALRKQALMFIGLSGTPTSKLEDWHALEGLMAPEVPDRHWNGATYTDYQRLGDPSEFQNSGLWQTGWTFERGIKEFHADRIKKARVFMADKSHYMKDSLPGLEQEELGDFADVRLSFNQLFDEYPEEVDRALALQKQENPHLKGNAQAIATTLLLRMQQLAANSDTTQQLLAEFVKDFLEPKEPCIFWTLFRSPPCEELQQTVRYLTTVAPTVWIMGGMTEKERWRAIDAFQGGSHRFLVAQVEAGGVGLNLTRAAKSLFLSIPFSYQTVSQCIGRQHRIGQERDVTSYFAMGHPVAAFARAIYDRRAQLNEVIPGKILSLLSKFGLDLPSPSEETTDTMIKSSSTTAAPNVSARSLIQPNTLEFSAV